MKATARVLLLGAVLPFSAPAASRLAASPARGYTPRVRRVRCPSCRREVAWEGNPHRPFCSDRCRLLDLAAWADERYRIPGEPVPTEPADDDDSSKDGR